MRRTASHISEKVLDSFSFKKLPKNVLQIALNRIDNVPI